MVWGYKRDALSPQAFLCSGRYQSISINNVDDKLSDKSSGSRLGQIGQIGGQSNCDNSYLLNRNCNGEED